MNDIADNTPVAVEIRGLTRLYNYRPALKNIDLIISEGERLVIFGPNGAGKTTLLKTIAALLKPTSGSVYIGGSEISSKNTSIRARVNLVSHNTYLYDDLTVAENLKFYGKMYDVPDLESRIKELIFWLRIESRMADRVGTLSNGLQQRVSIARALLNDPAVLLLDEPEVGLDAYAALVVKDIMLSESPRTVVMTTHNLERGIELAKNVIILDKGSIVYRSPVSEIKPIEFYEIYGKYTGTSDEKNTG
jgi:ABC-type multidrug transport system ATPase subunit